MTDLVGKTVEQAHAQSQQSRRQKSFVPQEAGTAAHCTGLSARLKLLG